MMTQQMILHLAGVNNLNILNTDRKWQYSVEIIQYRRRKYSEILSSRTVSEFNLPRLYQIYAHTMSSLASGEIKQLIAKGQNKFANDQAEKNKGFDLMMQRYMEKTYYKSAALMCGSLLGVPSIFQLHMGEDFERIMEKSMDDIERISCEAGKDYGLALQLVDDILDYVSTAEEMGKEEMSDLVQGNVTAPVYLTYLHKQDIPETGDGVTLDLLNQRKKTKEQALVVKGWVESGVGIQLTYLLAGLYVEAGLSELRKFNLEEEDLLGWRYLGHKLMTRRK